MKRKVKQLNKRGAEMTIGTIVIIILAIVVLVVLVYGFTVGWGDLFSKLTGLGGGQVNVQTIVQSCQIACSTQAYFDYCEKTRNIVFEEGKDSVQETCFGLENSRGGFNFGLAHCDKVQCDVNPQRQVQQPAVNPAANPTPVAPAGVS
ncbi:MAG: hypothetical protein RL557_537 [archaeon]|jgi:hypothetical protein